MSVQLLDKTRVFNKLLYDNPENVFSFSDIASVLSQILESQSLILSRKGKVLGIGESEQVSEIQEYLRIAKGEFINTQLNERLLNILSTKENINLSTLGFSNQTTASYYGIVSPIYVAKERLGSLFLYREEKPYDIDDIILTEFGSTVIGLEMLRSENEEAKEELRRISVVRSAISTLSYTELQAILHIFEELDGTEGILVASKIADRVGITRSVIVNALRKFESAGVIESKSSGMKGTYIKVVNDLVFDELAKIRPTMEN